MFSNPFSGISSSISKVMGKKNSKEKYEVKNKEVKKNEVKNKEVKKKKYEFTDEFYFLFYAQNQLPLFDEDRVIKTLIDNLRINNQMRIDILNYYDHNHANKKKVIENISQFNEIHKKNENIKILKINYAYYIFYLFNVYFHYNHYKILQELIKNELLKFDITINMLTDDLIFDKKDYILFDEKEKIYRSNLYNDTSGIRMYLIDSCNIL